MLLPPSADSDELAERMEEIVKLYLDMQDARRGPTAQQYRKRADEVTKATRALRDCLQNAPSEFKNEIARRFRAATELNLSWWETRSSCAK
jgi:hypothetical protein